MKLPSLHAVLLAATACVFLGCSSVPEAPTDEPAKPVAAEPAAAAPATVSEATPPAQPAAAQEPVPVPTFDPSSVTIEVKTAAITDIRVLIDGLNQVVRRHDYEAWLSHLTQEYVAYYSDPIRLAQYSEYPVLKNRGTVLRTLKDYFDYLVFPSHQNDHVDDIDFVSETLVKAITVSSKGSRDILYILEKHDDTWKIGIGR